MYHNHFNGGGSHTAWQWMRRSFVKPTWNIMQGVSTKPQGIDYLNRTRVYDRKTALQTPHGVRTPWTSCSPLSCKAKVPPLISPIHHISTPASNIYRTTTEVTTMIHLSRNRGHDRPHQWDPPEDGACSGGGRTLCHSLAKVGCVLLKKFGNLFSFLSFLNGILLNVS